MISAWSTSGSATGCIKVDAWHWQTGPGSGGNFYGGIIDASLSSSIYGNSTTVQPSSMSTLLILKY